MTKTVLGAKALKEQGQVKDAKCPFYGDVTVKNETLSGVVVKRDTSRSATIEWTKSHYIPKYERYAVKRYRLRVHNPLSIDAQLGQKVLVARTRPLSKTKNHVIIKIIEDAEAEIVNEDLGKKNAEKKKAAKAAKEAVADEKTEE